MARLVGVDLPRNKRMEIALTYIFGIGPTRAKKILAATGISPDLRTDDLTDEDIKLLRNELSNYHIEGDLRREITMNIKRLQEIGSFRGMRHKRKLPCRGQRTKTNARTQRGKKTGPVSKKKQVNEAGVKLRSRFAGAKRAGSGTLCDRRCDLKGTKQSVIAQAE